MQSTSELLLKDFFNLKLSILEMKCHFRKGRERHLATCWQHQAGCPRQQEEPFYVKFRVCDKLAMVSLRGVCFSGQIQF